MTENYTTKPNLTLDLGNGFTRIYTNCKEIVNSEDDKSFECEYVDIEGSDALQCVRDYKIKEIIDYYNSDDINLVSVQGVDIYLDLELRSKLRERIDAAIKRKASTLNISLNGTVFNLTPDTADEMLSIIIEQYGKAYDIKDEKIKEVDNSDDIEYIMSIDAKSNYPEKLVL